MKRWILLGFLILGVFAIGYKTYSVVSQKSTDIITPIGNVFNGHPLDIYTIENLSQRVPQGGQIVFDEAVATTSSYTAYFFHFPSGKKTISGLAHIPLTPDSRKRPVIIQCRGYVDRPIFESGVGTRRSAEVLAHSGFVSLAPDFLGYGRSDPPSDNVFEERFETYTAILDLIDSVQKTSFVGDPTAIGLWGHSNGGQIALSALAITGKPYPTTLWAPVTKPFPYSILYYTDEFEDRGKALRRELAAFESEYDVERYAFVNYLGRITGPIIIHQGTGDDAVPYEWSREFVSEMNKRQNGDVTYIEYPGADHNMMGAWERVVSRDIQFFRQHLQ